MATMVNTPRKKAELNSPSPYYEEFKGRNIEQMPLLIAAGMQPISFKQIWERRLEVIRSLDEAIKGNQPEEVIKAWQNLQSEWVYKRVDSGDGAVSHSSGSAKIALDALYLKLITPETQLRNGGVQLSDNYFKELDGELFTEAQVKRYFNKSLSKREVKRSPAWRALMREDHALLNEIADVAFAQVKERFGYKNKMMGIYLLRVPSEGADGRLWVAYGLYDGGGHVGVAGGNILVSKDGRLVGADSAPKARAEKTEVTLEQRVNAVLSATTGLVPDFARPHYEKEIRNALTKLER